MESMTLTQDSATNSLQRAKASKLLSSPQSSGAHHHQSIYGDPGDSGLFVVRRASSDHLTYQPKPTSPAKEHLQHQTKRQTLRRSRSGGSPMVMIATSGRARESAPKTLRQSARAFRKPVVSTTPPPQLAKLSVSQSQSHSQSSSSQSSSSSPTRKHRQRQHHRRSTPPQQSDARPLVSPRTSSRLHSPTGAFRLERRTKSGLRHEPDLAVESEDQKMTGIAVPRGDHSIIRGAQLLRQQILGASSPQQQPQRLHQTHQQHVQSHERYVHAQAHLQHPHLQHDSAPKKDNHHRRHHRRHRSQPQVPVQVREPLPQESVHETDSPLFLDADPEETDDLAKRLARISTVLKEDFDDDRFNLDGGRDQTTPSETNHNDHYRNHNHNHNHNSTSPRNRDPVASNNAIAHKDDESTLWSDPWTSSHQREPELRGVGTGDMGFTTSMDPPDDRSMFSFDTSGDADEWADKLSLMRTMKTKDFEDVEVKERPINHKDIRIPIVGSRGEMAREEVPVLKTRSLVDDASSVSTNHHHHNLGNAYLQLSLANQVQGALQDPNEFQNSASSLELLQDLQDDEAALAVLQRKQRHHRSQTIETLMEEDEVGSEQAQSYFDNDLEIELDKRHRFEEKEDMKYIINEVKSDPNVCMVAVDGRKSAKVCKTHTKPVYVSPCETVVSPMSKQYKAISRDPAYLHAQSAGLLWQSLVSQHVRFPSKWWANGGRSPSMGIGERQPWQYIGHHRVSGNPALMRKAVVPSRGSAGKILLHLVVYDLMTYEPVVDVAVGCFHPNARGVRPTPEYRPHLEHCRDVWMAIRRRTKSASVVEPLLCPFDDSSDEENNDRDKTMDITGDDDDGENEPANENRQSPPGRRFRHSSPLGPKHAVNNANMRAVFGESAPLETLILGESELYELLLDHSEGTMPPALVLIQKYVRST